MKRRLAVGASVVVAVGLASGSLSGQMRTFKAGIDVVGLNVIVVDRDKDGAPVTGLTERDFEVYEDGQKQAIKYFAGGGGDGAAGATAVPLHIGVLFDISGSMEDDIKFAKTAAVRFMKTLGNAEDITLVDFDTEVRVARFEQASFPELVERIRGRKAKGETALWDALGVYLDGASEQEGRKVLVLYTDGGDNSSKISFGDTLTLLKASDVTVYTIGLLTHQSQHSRIEQQMHLQQVADVTGGQGYFPMGESLETLQEVYDKIAREIQSQYTIGYLSTNQKTDGAWRKVEIRLTRPDLKGARIRTRKGYFGPYKAPATAGARVGRQ